MMMRMMMMMKIIMIIMMIIMIMMLKMVVVKRLNPIITVRIAELLSENLKLATYK